MKTKTTTFFVALALGLLGACGDDDVNNNIGDAGVDGSEEAGTQNKSISELLDGITLVDELNGDEVVGKTPSVKWADLPDVTRDALNKHAEDYREQYRSTWNAAGLAEKEKMVIESPTDAINANVDRVTAALFSAQIPEGFSATTDIGNSDLQTLLRRTYVGQFAVSRGAMIWHNVTAPEGDGMFVLDWDGVSPLNEVPVHDPMTFADIKAYGKTLEADILKQDSSTWSDTDKSIVEKLLYYARMISTASPGISIWGSSDMATPHGIGAWMGDPPYMFSADGGNIYNGDADKLLSNMNAFFNSETKWVNKGTVAGVANMLWPALRGPDSIAPYLTDERVVAEYTILQHWWFERLLAHPDAEKSCTIYTAEEQSEILTSFTASNFFDAQGKETFATLGASIEKQGELFTETYQDAADKALTVIFPTEAMLSAENRGKVIAAVEAQPFGAVIPTILSALDEATGTTDASTAFQTALDAVPTIGGYEMAEELRAEDATKLAAMWIEVRDYLSTTYDEGAVDYATVLAKDVTVNTGRNSFTTPEGITIGLASPRSAAQLYSILIHEAHHLANYGADLVVEGAAWEGAALTAEHVITPMFLPTVLDERDVSLALLLLVDRDARLVGLSDATLKVHARTSCDDSDTVAFAVATAKGWGLNDENAAEAGMRAHWGTQFLSYLTGEAVYLTTLDAVASELGMKLDPYAVQACGLPSVSIETGYVDALKSCLDK